MRKIFCVELKLKVLVGKANPENHKYDLMNVMMIGLNDDSYKKRATELHGYLGTIFSKKLKPAEKIRILKEEYGVEPTKEVKEGMEKMCNLGEALLEEGRQEGREEGRQEERKNTLRESARADIAETRANEAETRADIAEKRADAAETKANEAETRAYQAEKEVEYLKRLLEAEYGKSHGSLADRKTRHSGKKRGELWRGIFKKNEPRD